LSDWSLWERGDIYRAGDDFIVLEDPGGALFSVVQKADVTLPGQRPAMARDKGAFLSARVWP
jgi:hypothetical protein